MSGAAVASGDVGWVLVAMCGVAMVKVGIALAYALFAAQETGLEFDGQLARMRKTSSSVRMRSPRNRRNFQWKKRPLSAFPISLRGQAWLMQPISRRERPC